MLVRTHLRRVLVLGRDPGDVVGVAKTLGLEIVDADPEVVVTYGGDGLLLHSEREWPGVPKLPLRNSRRGKKCEPGEVREALERLAAGDLISVSQIKLRFDAKGFSQVGLNDVIVHNARPTSSLRYRVYLDEREFGDEIVGDGVVVATPFGSTAYYRSITRGIFHVGLGLAFNNSIEQVDHMVLREDVHVRVVITRGPAIAVADNHPELVDLQEGDEVVIRKDDARATILSVR
jgi:NAD+ kinase